MGVNSQVTSNAMEICPYCKKEVEILTGRVHKKKVYHLDCFLKIMKEVNTVEKREVGESEVRLLKYVAKLFALPSVSVKLQREIQDYIDRGMSYDNMYLTLHYVYDILQWEFPSYLPYPTLKVIDYKYDEAMEFWAAKKKLEEKSKDYDLATSVTVVKGKVRQKQNKKQENTIELIDIDNVVTQIEEQELSEKIQKIEDDQYKKELNCFNKEMLTIQKEFEDKRLPDE